MRTQRKNKQAAKSAGKHGQSCDWFRSFVSDWLRESREFTYTNPFSRPFQDARCCSQSSGNDGRERPHFQNTNSAVVST